MSDGNYERVVATAADVVDLFVPGIKAAIAELETKHGPLTKNLYRAFAILQREQGEVADAVLIATKAGLPTEAQVQHLAHELAQVIAVCIYILINLFGDRIDSGSTEPPILVPGSDKVQ